MISALKIEMKDFEADVDLSFAGCKRTNDSSEEITSSDDSESSIDQGNESDIESSEATELLKQIKLFYFRLRYMLPRNSLDELIEELGGPNFVAEVNSKTIFINQFSKLSNPVYKLFSLPVEL